MYRFRMQERVRVLPSRGGRDPGGEGRVTAREKMEDNRGEAVLYRVLIDGHEQQKLVADAKGRENTGFWYADRLVVPLEQQQSLQEVSTQRVRIFAAKGDGYEYRKTVYMPEADITETREALVRDHGLVVGELVYWRDIYLRLDKSGANVLQWTPLLRDQDALRGLYTQAVEAERLVGDPRQ